MCTIIYEIDDGKGYIIELDNHNSLIYKEGYINGKNWKGNEYFNHKSFWYIIFIHSKKKGNEYLKDK